MLTDYHFHSKDRKILNFLWGTLITTSAFVIYLELIPYMPYYHVSSLNTQSYTLTGSTAYVNPQFAFNNLIYSISYAWSQKLLYLLGLFGSVLFLPVLSVRRLLPAVPWLG